MATQDAPARFDERLAQRAQADGVVLSNGPQSSLEMKPKPVNPALQPHGDIPNTPLAVATIAFLLGVVFSAGAMVLVQGGWPLLQLGFFIAAWSAFHFLEFAVTAGWNREKLTVDSFLLNNGKAYHIAHAAALLEWLLTAYFRPQWKTWPYLTTVGFIITVGAQVIRSLAMIHASTNFSHQVATRKQAAHRLVTDGIYSWSRHPSYVGFFYWGIGTQIALQNPLSFLVYLIVLWRFFNYRIQAEERFLVHFFGQDYVAYRGRVRTRIPFIA